VLVRFEPPLAEALLQELADATRPFAGPPLPEALLIGARLPGDRANRVAPELNSFTNRFGMWAADAIDPLAGMWRLKLGRGSDPYAAAATLNETRGVTYAEPNFPIYGFSQEPNDPFYTSNNQWALRKIGAPDAWDITTGSSDITIAILDTGLAYGHSELRNKIITETARNFVAEPANEFAWDDNGHGTYVAGLAAAETNNGTGMAGVAWNARLLPIKVLDYGYQGSIATLSMGLAYVTTQPVQVVNMSTGGPVRSRILEETAKKAFDKGIVLVAAAGNGGKEEFNYPAAFDTVIAVGASDDQDRPASFSSYGPYLSIVAPGTDILSLNWASDKDYARNYGTSPACPLVAGTVALMLSVNATLTPQQVRNILEGTADTSPNLPPLSVTPGAGSTPTTGPGPSPTATATPIPVALTPPAVAQSNSTGAIQANTLSSNYSNQFGWGRLNAYRAVLAVRNGQTFPSHHATLFGTITGFPDPLDVSVSLDPGDTRYPDQNGRYQFDHLPPGTYRLVVESTKYNLRTATDIVIHGTDGETVQRNFDFADQVTQALNSKAPVGPFLPLKDITGDDHLKYFPESGHTISGRFKDFWESRGGLPLFGYPISQEFEEGGKTVQYFERVVLEYNAEYANTRDDVQPRLLGVQAAQNRTEPAFKRLAAPGTAYPVSPGVRYFDETGHTLSGPYRAFWEANGGLALFGYPISEPFNIVGSDGKPRQVQYFQRCRMEYFPENESPYTIQLGLLAKEAAKASGLLGKG
jgi:subtilisin family serine protease